MYKLLALVLFAPSLAFAQLEPDEEGVAEAFANLRNAVSLGEFPDVAELVACPVETDGGRPVASTCDTGLASHRVRVEMIVQEMTHLFPADSSNADSHYTVEEEGGEVFHLMLFQNVANVPFVLVAFTNVNETYLLTNLDTDDELVGILPPSSVVRTLEILFAEVNENEVATDLFAHYIVARNSTPERNWKANANPDIDGEWAFVDDAFEQIKHLLSASRGDYEIVGYETDRESEGEWHILNVRFDTHEEAVFTSFAFLPVAEFLLLGDVD
ncbi:MAG: hypothetical protein R3284_03255 [Rubricoccaceae bacterium]|nr:hypothetical protein [Rubricoccaceae bacterium]